MPANTAHGYPYPVGTDRVTDGDDAIKNLANAVESKLRVSAAGSVSVTATSSASGSANVTFPAGRFVNPPLVVCSPVGATAWYAAAGSVTASGVTINIVQRDGTAATATVTVNWIAIES